MLITPVRPTAPKDGRIAVTPQREAGKGIAKTEVQAAGPADEPVEYSSIFHGFLVLPPNQMSSYANDPVTSFATRTAPAAFNLYSTSHV
nr:hypothetical protein Iba_chr03cCG2600 [Ipomoea batatas]